MHPPQTLQQPYKPYNDPKKPYNDPTKPSNPFFPSTPKKPKQVPFGHEPGADLYRPLGSRPRCAAGEAATGLREFGRFGWGGGGFRGRLGRLGGLGGVFIIFTELKN